LEHYQSKNHFYDIPESVDINSDKFTSYVFVNAEIENSTADKSFILNVLKAAKLNVNENCNYTVLQASEQYKITMLKSDSTLKILCFGIDGKQLGLQVDHLKNTFLHLEGIEIVFGENPEKYKSEILKRALWESIKKLFNI